MKSKLHQACGITALFFLFFISGCKKETISKESTASPSVSSEDLYNNAQCKLKYLDWDIFYTHKFHYNNKGLADKWIIDYGGGWIDDITLVYDNNNRLVKAYDSYFGTPYTFSFTYKNNRIVKVLWKDETGVNAGAETLLTYDNKGNIVRQDDIINDIRICMTYDDAGNRTLAEYYASGVLYYSDSYTFEQPVKDPLLTVTGIDISFPFYGLGRWDKYWFTSNRAVQYFGTDSLVNYGYDPSRTTVKKYKNYPVVFNYYDSVNQVPAIITFKYDCSVSDNISDNRPLLNNQTGNRTKWAGPMHIGSAKSIKERIQQLRKQ